MLVCQRIRMDLRWISLSMPVESDGGLKQLTTQRPLSVRNSKFWYSSSLHCPILCVWVLVAEISNLDSFKTSYSSNLHTSTGVMMLCEKLYITTNPDHSKARSAGSLNTAVPRPVDLLTACIACLCPQQPHQFCKVWTSQLLTRFSWETRGTRQTSTYHWFWRNSRA